MRKFYLSAFSDEAGETLEEQIAALQRNGIRYMEIRSVNGVNICKTPLEAVAEYKKELDDAGIRVAVIGSCIGKVSLEEDYQQHYAMFLHTLGVAKILGAEGMRMFSIFLPQGQDFDSYRDLVFGRLGELLRVAEAAGITLYHENEKGIYGDSPERVASLMREFGGRMKFVYDAANMIQSGYDPLDAYLRIRSGISYLHMKDVQKETKFVVPSGEGDCQLGSILRDFAQDHDGVMLTVEPHLKTFSGLTDEVSMGAKGQKLYANHTESFDAAVSALKQLLEQEGFSYE